MKCPVCTTTDLLMTDRQGVEIDYCPQCRGVWLDRGELDKIIERTIPTQAPAAPQPPPQYGGSSPFARGKHDKHDSSQHGHHESHETKHGYGYPHKKKSVFSELFDF